MIFEEQLKEFKKYLTKQTKRRNIGTKHQGNMFLDENIYN